jgi:hypothetical protein
MGDVGCWIVFSCGERNDAITKAVQKSEIKYIGNTNSGMIIAACRIH